MSIWSDIGDAVSDAADAVAGAIEDVVNAVEEVITDVVETVGNGVSDAAHAVGTYLSDVPLIGGALRDVFYWVGDVVSGFMDLQGAVIKGVFGIVGGWIAGVIRIIGGGVGGLLNWDGTVFVKGVRDILSGIGGAVLDVGGKWIGLVQSVIPAAAVGKAAAHKSGGECSSSTGLSPIGSALQHPYHSGVLRASTASTIANLRLVTPFI
jgi:phage-related protein